jgi:hypothetical protein
MIKDRHLKKVCEKAETLFDPKKIVDGGDWLKSQKEKGQTVQAYSMSTVKNIVKAPRNKIYLLVAHPWF